MTAFTCPVLPAALQRRNAKGIWKLVFIGRMIKLQCLPRDPVGPAFWQDVVGTADKSEQPRCPSTDEWIKKLWYIYTME